MGGDTPTPLCPLFFEEDRVGEGRDGKIWFVMEFVYARDIYE